MDQFTVVNTALALVAIVACIFAFSFSTKNDALKAEIVELQKDKIEEDKRHLAALKREHNQHQENLELIDKIGKELERAITGYNVVKAELEKCQGGATPSEPVRKRAPRKQKE